MGHPVVSNLEREESKMYPVVGLGRVKLAVHLQEGGRANAREGLHSSMLLLDGLGCQDASGPLGGNSIGKMLA